MQPKQNPPEHTPASLSKRNRKLILARFTTMLLHFIASTAGKKAKLLFTLLLLLLVVISGLNVLNSYVGRSFMTAIELRQMSEFGRQALLMIGVFAASTIAAVFARFCEERLGLLWRNWLTSQAVVRYLEGRVFQFIEEMHSIQHPDQRISEDIRVLTGSALSFVLMLVNSLFSIIAFSGVLWSISPQLFLVSLAYAALGSLLTIWLGRPLINLNSKQLDREADFRSELLHVRENSELIALLRQEGRLRTRVLKRLEDLTSNMLQIIGVNRNLGFFTGGYNYLIQIIPALVVAPFFIEGRADFGIIAQSALAFTILVNAFSLIVTQFPSISNFAAVIARLSALSEAIEKAETTPLSTLQLIEDPTQVAFEHVTIHSPEDEFPLIKDLHITIPKGTRVLIHGQSKQAMTALFKAVAGIGNHARGTLRRPSLNEIHFLPEKPYVAPGTLRQTVLCQQVLHHVQETQIQEMLQTLGLTRAVETAGGLDKEHDNWDHLLSLGEQKLLLIARLLLAAPPFAFLDRIQSALTDEQINLVTHLLCSSNITYVNLGKPGDRPECYDARLELTAEGTWKWEAK